MHVKTYYLALGFISLVRRVSWQDTI